MKKAIVIVSALGLLLSINFAFARPPIPANTPVSPVIQYILDWLEDLQQQVNNIELIPGPPGEQGPPGPMGPQGEPGVSSQDGAYFKLLGNAGGSAYYAVGDKIYAIDLNQNFWEESTSLPPVPVEDLVFYNYLTAVTYDGEGWRNVDNFTRWESIGFIPDSPDFILMWGSEGIEEGQFDSVSGLDVDSQGIIYILDAGNNNRVQKFDSDGNFIASWPVVHGGEGLKIDSADNIYVTQSSYNTIWKFDTNGNVLAQWYNEDNQNHSFLAPWDIVEDSNNNLFVADNHRILKMDSNGNIISEWGSQGNGDGQFSQAVGIAVDSQNNVYVTDAGYNHRIQVFDNNGNFIRLWSWSNLINPIGIDLDTQDNVYVVSYNGHSAYKFTNNGEFLSTWGSSYDNPGSGPGEFNSPRNVAIDQDNSIYISDQGNHRIQKFGY